MSSFLRAVRRRKKIQSCWASPEVLSREEYAAFGAGRASRPDPRADPAGDDACGGTASRGGGSPRGRPVRAQARAGCRSCATGATRDRFDWAGSGWGSGFLGFGAIGARSRFEATRRFTPAAARSMSYCSARSVRDQLPELRAGGRVDPRSNRTIEFVGLALVRGGKRVSASGVPGSGSLGRGLSWRSSWMARRLRMRRW